MTAPPKSLEEAFAQRDELLARAKAFALQSITTFDDAELAAALDALAKADSFGAIFDPTAYMRSAEARERVAELYRAVRRFRSIAAGMVEADVARAKAELARPERAR